MTGATITEAKAAPAAEFQSCFVQLRAIFAAYESTCVVLHDEPQRYYLGTHQVRPKDGYRIWFGGVEIKRNYVSAHVMAVYMQPALLERLSPALKKRMQGKACLNARKRTTRLPNWRRSLPMVPRPWA